MNVNIALSSELESLIRRRANAAGLDVETYLRQIVVERLDEDEVSDSPPNDSHDEWMARLHEIIALHPVSQGRLDDSRESIYAGCGE